MSEQDKKSIKDILKSIGKRGGALATAGVAGFAGAFGASSQVGRPDPYVIGIAKDGSPAITQQVKPNPMATGRKLAENVSTMIEYGMEGVEKAKDARGKVEDALKSRTSHAPSGATASSALKGSSVSEGKTSGSLGSGKAGSQAASALKSSSSAPSKGSSASTALKGSSASSGKSSGASSGGQSKSSGQGR